jgi:hypothetical protein
MFARIPITVQESSMAQCRVAGGRKTKIYHELKSEAINKVLLQDIVTGRSCTQRAW